MRPLLLATALLVIGCAPAAVPATATPAAPATSTAQPAATAEPSNAPSPGPVPTPAPVVVEGSVHNEGKAIIADVSATHGTRQLYYGESGSVAIVTQGSSYALNDVTLDDASVRCTATSRLGEPPTQCDALRIVPSFALVAGRTYTLRFVGEVVGSFVAIGIASAVPHVVSVAATQQTLSVRFDRPMNHVGACGTNTADLYVSGTMENLLALSGPVFPAELAAYTATDPLYRTAMRLMGGATLDADCRAVTFRSNAGAAAGSYVVRIAGIEDEDGNVIEPASFRVTVVDEGPPTLFSAQLALQTPTERIVRVAYSEAMAEETVTDPERYEVGGRPLPDGSRLECELADCRWVKLTMPASAFSYGEELTITVVGVTDTSGNAMEPDAVTSRPFKVY